MEVPLIRPATPSDVPSLLVIEAQSFSCPHWEAQDFLRYATTVADIGGAIAGLIVTRELFAGDSQAPAEVEILNLVVASSFRRLGIASRLLQARLQRPAIYFLEVRESNLAAQALYRQFGFTQIGFRPDYYRSPAESALVMQVKRC